LPYVKRFIDFVRYAAVSTSDYKLLKDWWMINREGFKREWSWPNRIIIPVLTCRDWRNHKNQYEVLVSRPKFVPRISQVQI